MARLMRMFFLHVQHALNFRARSFVWFLISFINPLVLLLFWQGALSQTAVLNGWTLDTMRSYYLLLIAAQSTLIAHIEEDVATYDIRMGDLSKYLVRPVSYFTMKLYVELPHRIINGVYALVAIAILLATFRTPLTHTSDPAKIILAIATLVAAFTLSFLFKMVLAFCAFWILNIDSLLETNDVLSFALSGLIIPLDLFPQTMQHIANITPYPYMLYYPITAVLGLRTIDELLHILLVQVLYIVALSTLYQIMWRRGIRKFTGMGQ